jgi:hypothetical protein
MIYVNLIRPPFYLPQVSCVILAGERKAQNAERRYLSTELKLSFLGKSVNPFFQILWTSEPENNQMRESFEILREQDLLSLMGFDVPEKQVFCRIQAEHIPKMLVVPVP